MRMLEDFYNEEKSKLRNNNGGGNSCNSSKTQVSDQMSQSNIDKQSSSEK
jgi:hypothetical protein